MRFFLAAFPHFDFFLTWTFGWMVILIAIFSNYSPILLVNSDKKKGKLSISSGELGTLLVSWLPKSIKQPSFLYFIICHDIMFIHENIQGIYIKVIHYAKKTTDSVRCSLIYILFLKFYKIKFTSKQKYSHYETGMFMY